MLLKYHIILGAILSLILVNLFNFSWVAGIIIFLSSVLIDVDHYLYYVHRKKDWSLINAYSWFIIRRKKLLTFSRKQRSQFYTSFDFLHGFEVLIFLFLLGKFISVYFYYILIGFTIHLSFDIFDVIHFYGRIDKFSLIYDYVKFGKLNFVEE